MSWLPLQSPPQAADLPEGRGPPPAGLTQLVDQSADKSRRAPSGLASGSPKRHKLLEVLLQCGSIRALLSPAPRKLSGVGEGTAAQQCCEGVQSLLPRGSRQGRRTSLPQKQCKTGMTRDIRDASRRRAAKNPQENPQVLQGGRYRIRTNRLFGLQGPRALSRGGC